MRNAIQTSGEEVGGSCHYANFCECCHVVLQFPNVFERSDIHGYAQFKRIMNNVNSEELGIVVASAVGSYLQPNSQLRQRRTEGNSTIKFYHRLVPQNNTSTTLSITASTPSSASSSATRGQVRTAHQKHCNTSPKNLPTSPFL